MDSTRTRLAPLHSVRRGVSRRLFREERQHRRRCAGRGERRILRYQTRLELLLFVHIHETPPVSSCFFLRKALGYYTVIPTQLLNRRWLLSSVRSAIEFNSSSDTTTLLEPFAVRRVLPDTDRPWDNNRKYREALPIATGIWDAMAGLGMPQYHAAMTYLQEVARQFKKGDCSHHDQARSSNRDAVMTNEHMCEQHEPVSAPANPLGVTGNHSDETGNHSGETDELSSTTEIPTQITAVRSGSVELGVTTEEPSNAETGELRAVLEPALDTPFEIANPPRSRGRPKRSAKAKKAARNLAVTAASDDSDLYASNLSLASVQEAFSTEPTYNSAAELLSKFKVFEYGVKFMAPTARKMSNLPPSKSVIQLGSITRILRPEHIKMCYAKVSALQAKSRGLPESDVVLGIIGFGVYSTEALRIMNTWHRAMKVTKLLNKAIRWIDTIDFAIPMPTSFQRNADSGLLSRMKLLPLLSTKTDILELVGRNQLSDTTNTIVMGKLFGARTDVVTVNPAVIGMILNHSTTPLPGLEYVFVGLTTEKVLTLSAATTSTGAVL